MCEAKWSYTTKQTGNNLKQERFQQVVYKAYTSYRTYNYTSTYQHHHLYQHTKHCIRNCLS